MGSLVLPSRYDGVILELTPVKHPFDGDFAVVPAWEAKLTAAGIEASAVCPESESADQTLAEFFDELYDNIRGWEDVRHWESHMGKMKLDVRHDGINTVHVAVALEGGGVTPRWHLVGDVFVDPGLFGPLASKARIFAAESMPGAGADAG
ncbi:MAG: hypothetical protein QOG15_1919 [Solirubrobacteraceae bacterium]|jgi:hypothetical protein|nr:hypothetical protein [Solirubrobacteraceae bacterium]